jgi:hypothetical protein
MALIMQVSIGRISDLPQVPEGFAGIYAILIYGESKARCTSIKVWARSAFSQRSNQNVVPGRMHHAGR